MGKKTGTLEEVLSYIEGIVLNQEGEEVGEILSDLLTQIYTNANEDVSNLENAIKFTKGFVKTDVRKQLLDEILEAFNKMG